MDLPWSGPAPEGRLSRALRWMVCAPYQAFPLDAFDGNGFRLPFPLPGARLRRWLAPARAHQHGRVNTQHQLAGRLGTG